MFMYLNFLINLTEKDKRILIALLIIFIVLFVLIAYIGNGIKALMRRYSKGIDGYMHELCREELVTNPKQFIAQVYKKETRKLYFATRWILRIFILSLLGFIVYASIFKPSGVDQPLFAFAFESIKKLNIVWEIPKGEFFGFTNFPIDWPHIIKGPTPEFNIPSITSYLMLVVSIVSIVGVTNSTLKFMARLSRARKKGNEVFTKSLDDANFAK